MGVVTAVLPARAPSLRFVALAAAAPAVLALSRLLPAEGAGLAVRLGAAAVCVLLVPGALVLRAVAWPESPALAVAGSFALSLAIVGLALALVFAAEASLALAYAVILVLALAAAVPAALVPAARFQRADLVAVAVVVAAGVIFAAAVWWSGRTLGGDALFHAARARKLAELPTLNSVSAVNEFRNGALHPGYAFPLWHAVLALLSRLAGVDVAVTVVRLAAVLVPLSFVLAYAAGRELFRSWAGGVATAAAQLALLGLGRASTGSYEFLALPATAGRVLLPAAVLAFVFAYAHSGRRALLLPLGAGALALAMVHPTYAIFLGILVTGFLLAHLVLDRDDRGRIVRVAASLGAIVVPSVLFFLWLLPAVRGSASVTPSAAQKARDLAHYAGFFHGSGHFLRIAPEAIARAGPATVAGLLAVPFAFFASRRLWAALVLGGSLGVLAVLLVPFLFEPFSQVVSLSQARRLIGFLPLPFALAGAAVLLGRLQLGGALFAAGAGLGLALAYPGEFTYRVQEGGPAWPVLVAALGGLVALVAGALMRRRGPAPDLWCALAALAFALPIGALGVDDLRREAPDPKALTPGAIAALRADVKPGQVLFGDTQAIYHAAAYVPVYISAAPAGHVAVNAKNRPGSRRADVARFFAGETSEDERRRLLDRYGASWLLVDKSLPYPNSLTGFLQRVYEDGRYALYRVEG
jgi:hypothetical protein